MKGQKTSLAPGQIRLDLIPLDWPLTPLGEKKNPYKAGWQNKPFGVSEIETELVEGHCKAIGLMSGPAFNNPYGLVWVDADGPSVAKLIVDTAGCSLEEALPKTLTIKSGKEGRFRKLYKLERKDWQHFTRNKYVWHAEANREQLEVLWEKHQGALMGLHPETDGYFTAEGEGFEWAHKLPLLPAWLLNGIINKNVRQGKPAAEHSRFVGPGFAINTTISLERDIKLALEGMYACPPEAADDHDIWITIGQSLHSLDESLLEHWDNWSRLSDKYKEGECHKRWKSFSKEGGRGVGSIIYVAKDYGWHPPQDHKILPADDALVEQTALLLNNLALEQEINFNYLPDSSPQMNGTTALLAPEELVDTRNTLSLIEEEEIQEKGKKDKIRNAPASVIADVLMQDYKGRLLFNRVQNKFFCYELHSKGLWSWMPTENVKGDIRNRIQKMGESLVPKGFSINLVNDIFSQLQISLLFDKWYDNNKYLLFNNGVLDVEAKKLLPFNKNLYLTQHMPYDYNSEANCEDIITWLKYTQRDNWGRVQVLRAWLRATLLSCYDMQKFIEIIGPGKSGKSTYANLAVALVGKNNVHSTDFNQLETNRFESTSLMGKKLVLFQDMDRWGGSVSKLKALTGGDWIRIERKYQSENPEPFQFHGLVMITANEAIQSTDYTSGLARRRLTIPFDRPFDGSHTAQRELIKFDSEGNPQGEFAALLPGLVNWLLDMSTEDMRAYIMNTGDKVQFLKTYAKTQSLRSSPLLDWMEHTLYFAPGEMCPVGFAKPEGHNMPYLMWDKWLYASYCEFCKRSNVNIMSRNRFEPLFFDTCQHQLKLNIYHKRTSKGIKVYNIGIRNNDENRKQPSLMEVSADKEKFKEQYGNTLDCQENNERIEGKESDE
jgi:phage/plasmid-associated DNA primase